VNFLATLYVPLCGSAQLRAGNCASIKVHPRVSLIEVQLFKEVELLGRHKMFEAILFDFDGTLVDFVDSDIQSLQWLHAHVSASVPFEDFLETAVTEITHFHQLVDDGQIDPLLMHEFRLKRTFDKHEIPWRSDYLMDYKSKLVTACVPFEGVQAMLQSAKQKATLGLVTNAYDGQAQRKRIRNSGLENFFEAIIVAGEVGIYKPDPDIFLYALKSIGAVPSKTLFVGDSIKHDIAGAKMVGVTTVLFRKQANGRSHYADYAVIGIEALRDLLNRMIKPA
jgi:putative hydrolase of the HAD superfamily